MKNIISIGVLLIALSSTAFSQVRASGVVSVWSNPSGSCPAGSPMRNNVASNALYDCQLSSPTALTGTWTAVSGGGGGSGTVTSVGLSSTLGSVSGSPVTTSGTLALTVNASDIVGKFSSCSGTQYLGADGSCHTASGGSVTSVGFSSDLGTVTGSPVTSSGTLALAVSSSQIVGKFSGCSGTLYLGADGACHNAGGVGSAKAQYYPAGIATGTCGGGVSANWNNLTDVCLTLGVSVTGVSPFTNSGGTGSILWHIPSTWDGNSPTLNIEVLTSDNTSGNADFTPKGKCYTTGDDLTAGSYNSGTLVSTAVPSGSATFKRFAMTLTIPVTGCTAGDLMVVGITRSASDTYGNTIYLQGGTLTAVY